MRENKRPDLQARSVHIRDGIGYVELTRGYVAEVDEVDVPLVSGWSWTAEVRADGYVTASIRQDGKKIYMHRAIMGFPGRRYIDHIDGNPLNNRRSNLRVCHPSKNNQNRKPTKNRDLPKGVSVNPKGSYPTWIRSDGKRFFLGNFKTLEAAAAARFVAEKLLHGEFSRTCEENLKLFFSED